MYICCLSINISFTSTESLLSAINRASLLSSEYSTKSFFFGYQKKLAVDLPMFTKSPRMINQHVCASYVLLYCVSLILKGLLVNNAGQVFHCSSRSIDTLYFPPFSQGKAPDQASPYSKGIIDYCCKNNTTYTT